MIPLLPKAGVRVRFKGILADHEKENFRERMFAELMDSDARDLLVDLLARFATVEKNESSRCTTATMDALVMRQEDYEEAIMQAYLMGQHNK